VSVGLPREVRVGLACAFSILFIWTGFILVSRFSAKGLLTPWDMAALRYGGAFLAVLPLAARHGWPRLTFRQAAGVVGTAALGFPLFAFAGFQFAPASHGGVMLPGMLPLQVAVLLWLALGERWTRVRVASLGLVVFGVVLLARDTFGAHPGAWRGDLLLFSGSFCWAVYTLLVRIWRISALQATLAIALYTAPVYLPVWLLVLPSGIGAAPIGEVGFQLVYQGALAVVVAGFLFTRALTALGPMALTAITAAVPALTALAAWPLLGEPLGAEGLAGVGSVTAAMVLGVAQAREGAPAERREAAREAADGPR
jgi:drug/metabolite transporter (DMT)-like permease